MTENKAGKSSREEGGADGSKKNSAHENVAWGHIFGEET